MKKLLNTFLFLAIGSTLIMNTGCQKYKTGDLVVNTVDGLGSSVGSGKTVYLYNNASDYSSATYSKTATTDNAGKVTFSNLDPGTYYVDCDWTNNLGTTMTSSGSGTVEKKMTTTITIAP